MCAVTHRLKYLRASILLKLGSGTVGSRHAVPGNISAWIMAQRRPSQQENMMLYYAAVFFVIAIAAAILGFTGIAAGAAEIAKILFFIFLVIFIVTLVLGLRKRP